MLLLEAHHVKHYVQDRLLLDVDQLQIHQNDRIGLVGRNGSGKTTLLQILAKKISPEEGVVIQHTQCELLPQFKRTDTTKSGGEVTQEYIQKALVKDPELLLADEPTTNLDTDHIEWLEKKLREWQGAFIIVSHDREFLDALCTTIWEINEGKIREYTGNYSDYVKQKEVERHQAQLAYEKYEKKKKQLEEALKLKEKKAERATKTPKRVSESEVRGTKPYFAKKQKKLQKTAKAIETRLEKLEKVEKVKELPPLKMNLPNAETFKNRIIFRVEDVTGMIGERVLWSKASFHVRGGDKLAIIGPNGSGKTTLVKKIINQEPGITLSPSVKIGYFSQNLNILDVEKSIIENVQSSSKQNDTLIRTVLARMHFFRDDVYKPVGVLSGGERVKVALAKLFLSDINTLILDEPTNFLDTESVEALESLLKEYEGSVIFVSHDRRFIENIATRILVIRNQKIKLFEGTYQQYKHAQLQKTRDTAKDKRLLLETKISEVLSRLSIEPSEELEMEFQKLLKEKRELDTIE
ncbi:Vga family ABC-F type ribosomal protection protein [Thermaerobacillus caldiproteolyticus]|uniref:Pleuromutilin/lincosamide/streptogramin A transport system ATP-binding/permease protein n=1 Tax=Thermaerobacillus caldiproteolyticus TaxID=247480 RepID=A0A7V9Z8X5_9BACL|nr:Vga family ABC-F type ribosomal protection protein [Anoxybacillus caldiproteolyticus]MBA2876229.1 pleuromutilin/lincosamide/streptogramin A transport system ATP-binding/permease protein [Anoxybacillus caldiproteolyticus]